MAEPLPYAENAVVDVRKLRDYCLNPDHRKGRDKARLFASALGMTAEDAESLRQILLEKVKTEVAVPGLRDEFGQRYRMDFTLEWQDRRASILNVMRSNGGCQSDGRQTVDKPGCPPAPDPGSLVGAQKH